MSDSASPPGATDSNSPNGPRPVHLELLPPEILTTILELLLPQPPEVGETKPVEYEKLVPGEPWYDFTRSCYGLRSLCLVNRRFSTLAFPYLYHTVAILNEDAMVLLFRTLTERLDYGSWVRYLGIHLTLTSDIVTQETRRALSHYMPDTRIRSSRLDPLAPLFFAISIMGMRPHMNVAQGFGDPNFVPEMVVAFLLKLLPKLEMFLLQVPIYHEHLPYNALIGRLQNSPTFSELELPLVPKSEELYGGQADVFIRRGFDPDFLRTDMPPLHNVHTLLLQGDPEELDLIDVENPSWAPDVYGCHAPDYYPLFACIPKLTTLEVSADLGEWENTEQDEFLMGDEFHPYLSSARHIFLHDSCAGPKDLYQILKNAPNLETLYMTPAPSDESRHVEPALQEDPESFDAGLKKYGKNLRHLDVGWYEWYGGEGEIGPDGRLSSLPTLNKLEKLCIQLAVLYGTDPAAALYMPLADMLPPNIVDLTLEDWWWSSNTTYERMECWMPTERIQHYQSQGEYRRTAVRMLEQFASDAKERLPRLRKVLLLCKIPWTWMMEEGVDIDFHFQTVRELFEKNGVKFTVEDSSEWIPMESIDDSSCYIWPGR
ncbi:hypothetical protein QBC47DRAFT_379857 [Echria macrotheca]|uniref:Rhodanese domain-containing protein n=1 Tax=Echria macrotheca TaxID=438768 RepID=A0AAJ0FCQ5_9PEZI|nr:hypothetical protein QBC47DRAFT_379857 [Echria macrotheca]